MVAFLISREGHPIHVRVMYAGFLSPYYIRGHINELVSGQSLDHVGSGPALSLPRDAAEMDDHMNEQRMKHGDTTKRANGTNVHLRTRKNGT